LQSGWSTIVASTKHGPGFHHLAIRAFDFDKTLEFYKNGLGFKRAYGWGTSGNRAAMLSMGDGNYIEVFEGRTGDQPAEGAVLHFALRVADADASYASAISAGATDVSGPKAVDIQGDHVISVRIAFVKGLDGEVIEFFHNDEL
jgi:glyoxylase I family protein